MALLEHIISAKVELRGTVFRSEFVGSKMGEDRDSSAQFGGASNPYLLINARGDAYIPEHPLARREPRFFWNLLSEPISAILEELAFDSNKHAKRYS